MQQGAKKHSREFLLAGNALASLYALRCSFIENLNLQTVDTLKGTQWAVKAESLYRNVLLSSKESYGSE
jgi:hypothetical protein